MDCKTNEVLVFMNSFEFFTFFKRSKQTGQAILLRTCLSFWSLKDAIQKVSSIFYDILGPAATLNATKIRSWAHRLCQWWTNLVPPIVLEVAYDKTQWPSHLFVQDTLDPHRHPHNVRWNDKPSYAVVNIAREPHRALSTFVSFSKSCAFCGDGPSTILDIKGVEYITKEPNVDERERAMGFLTGTTQLSDHSISEY